MKLQSGQRYNRAAIGWALVSGAMAIICGWLLRNTDPSPAMRLTYAALPVIPSILYLLAVVKAVRALDELHRRIQLEAVAFAFVATLVLSLSYGMLQKSGFFRGWAWNWEGIWGLMIVTWVAGQVIANRQYS